MASYQQRSCRYPNLLVTVKPETEERSVTEIDTKQRTHRSKNNYYSSYFYPTTIYYNSNHRYQQAKQHSTRSSSSTIQHRSKNHDHFYYYNQQQQQQQQQPIRPLMEIKNNQFSSYNNLNDNKITYSNLKQREPKQRGQYRNRKAELDWDHAFDLDQIDLYTTQNDSDNYSLISVHSSGDNSLSSE
ncbi:unnamed protein product [Rotaria sp. Silwood2]|nr:unnamed protein product [Rotaria sp. Silwood2]CAF3290790.1 unnamed protein product [Rotaria sp. Silwood2]CAF4190931.1 unnamed protein product [Rotaria sp. Silwood2]CAF4360722.1 unnamed protein product [Rotaria sp. Silwood2]